MAFLFFQPSKVELKLRRFLKFALVRPLQLVENRPFQRLFELHHPTFLDV